MNYREFISASARNMFKTENGIEACEMGFDNLSATYWLQW